MNNHYSGKIWIVFIKEEINSVYSDLEMNSAYSEKKWIVFIQGRNEYCLFKAERYKNSVYSGKKWIVYIQGRNE